MRLSDRSSWVKSERASYALIHSLLPLPFAVCELTRQLADALRDGCDFVLREVYDLQGPAAADVIRQLRDRVRMREQERVREK